jgi:hypothetical protein
VTPSPEAPPIRHVSQCWKAGKPTRHAGFL